ncbi:hypothetical protein Afil01_07670 [Actinorhabdospora filicis]|uniref:Uncharacterized protein n=1 Tax=Actinorhabdospora filicis TaxID=1785913 RepID=A0A9W6SH98_9ACTN|nr:hypothetical protein [Actinorhabdospora filicis]GLZ75960.1 hypothetical protein Afil01_07670 [Actinorhabdospora filicis]
MTSQTSDDGLYAVEATPEQLNELLALADEIDSDELARHALSMGLTPPLAGVEYWEMVLTYPENDDDPNAVQLAWLGPDPHDQGDAQ